MAVLYSLSVVQGPSPRATLTSVSMWQRPGGGSPHLCRCQRLQHPHSLRGNPIARPSCRCRQRLNSSPGSCRWEMRVAATIRSRSAGHTCVVAYGKRSHTVAGSGLVRAHLQGAEKGQNVEFQFQFRAWVSDHFGPKKGFSAPC